MVEKHKGYGRVKDEIYEYVSVVFPGIIFDLKKESKMDFFLNKWEAVYKEEFSKLMNSEEDSIYYFDYSDFEHYCQNTAYSLAFNRISEELK